MFIFRHAISIRTFWLFESVLSNDFSFGDLPNYVVLVRRDRHEHENRGGVIGFVRFDVKNIVT